MTDHPQLDCSLAVPLPEQMEVGRGTIIRLFGWVQPSQSSVRSMQLIVDDVLAENCWLLGRETFNFVRGATAPPPHYDCAFMGCASIPAVDGRRFVELRLRSMLGDGIVAEANLGQVELVPSTRPESPVVPGRVAVCIATYNPPAELFARQIESIRRQTHDNWVCVLSDDGSSPESQRVMDRILDDDPRFILNRSNQRLGFYQNFERAIRLAPADAEFVALSDQDDVWHRDKLATLLAEFHQPSVALAYADMRVVDADGAIQSETFWTNSRNSHTDMASLILTNTVTGAASMMRREVVERALPFPTTVGFNYHDHWLAAVAMSIGDLAFVQRPLHDYVQHGHNAIGHAGSQSSRRSWGAKIGGWVSPSAWRASLYDLKQLTRLNLTANALRSQLFAQALMLRCSDRFSSGKQRTVERFSRLRSVRTLGWLAVRSVTRLGRRSETQGQEYWHLMAAAYSLLAQPLHRIRRRINHLKSAATQMIRSLRTALRSPASRAS